MKALLRFINSIKNGFDTSVWKLEYRWFKPAQEGLREALCTLGNGYFGTRGAAPESGTSRIHYPGTYIAGVYNTLATNIAGRTILNEDLVNCPNWLFLTFRVGKGEWIVPATINMLSYHQELCMQRGMLSRRVRVKDRKDHRTLIEMQRIVHMHDPHRAALRYCILPENYEGWIVVRSAIDGTVQNTGVARYRQLKSKHLISNALGCFSRNGVYLSVTTSNSNIKIATAARVRIFSRGRELRPESRILAKGKKAVFQEFSFYAKKKQQYEIEKVVSIYTSNDKGVRKPRTAAINSAKSASNFTELNRTHRQRWNELWKKCDIQINGDVFAQKVLRLHTFHLLQTASSHNNMIDAGMPARGLHGEAYRGHIFWDELFVLPFYDFHEPDVTRALLRYRYRRLPQARTYATENGYKGSMFPWQSGSSGEEETQIVHLNPMSGQWGPDNSRIQRHVSFAIAYNTWQHYYRTHDMNFLTEHGAELILSIAQFGASLTYFDDADGRYHTEGLMGPDEFHEKLPGAEKAGFKDNAYTNILIVYTFMIAQKVIKLLSEEHKRILFNKLGLCEKDFKIWNDITHKMNIIINSDGIISQFDGYFDLKELDWDAYRRKYGNIHRMDRILKAEGKSPDEYKVAKQADVLMLFYILPLQEIKQIFNNLGYKCDKNLLKKNYEYYVQRTSHGSTLSKVVHCYISDLLGRSKEAWRWYQEVLKSDIQDTQGGTTPEGIHTGVMAGSLDILMRAFVGIHITDDHIAINPRLPKQWSGIRLKLLFRSNWITVEVMKKYITLYIQSSRKTAVSMPFEINGVVHTVTAGKTHRIELGKKGNRVREES